MADPNIVVETPEQVGIDFEIAGVGSRFMAAVLDGICMLILLLAAIVLPVVLLKSGSRAAERAAENLAEGHGMLDGVDGTVAVIVSLSAFLVMWGYYIVSELVTDGRSPGKRAVGLRVVRDNGLPIGAAQSIIRNLVRAVDFLPGLYGVGLVAVMASSRTQRLGDLAAGTLVVKDRGGGRLGAVPTDARIPALAAPAAAPVAPLLTPAERELVERFIARSRMLDDAARLALARSIAAPLRARFGDRGIADDETFLIAISRPGAGGGGGGG